MFYSGDMEESLTEKLPLRIKFSVQTQSSLAIAVYSIQGMSDRVAFAITSPLILNVCSSKFLSLLPMKTAAV